MTDKNTDLIKEESIGQAFGRLGGRATLRKYGKQHFKKLSQKAAELRTKKAEAKRAQ